MKILLSLAVYLITSLHFILAAEHLSQEARETFPHQIHHYLNNLPKIDRQLSTVNLREKAHGIVRFMCQFFPMTNSAYEVVNLKGQHKLADHFLRFLTEQRKILMSLTAYPFKSLNTQRKVIACHTDLAELIGILTLNHICCEIDMIHSKGAAIHVVSDRVAFVDLLPIRAYEHLRYQVNLIKLITPFADHIYPICPVELDFQQYLKAHRNDSIHPGEDKVRAMSIFADEEIKCQRYNRWKKEDPTRPKTLGYNLAVNSERFRRFLQAQYPELQNTIHLSIHPYEDVSIKLGLGLVHGSRGSPWHGIPVLDELSVYLSKTKIMIRRNNQTQETSHKTQTQVPPVELRKITPYILINDLSLNPLKFLVFQNIKLYYLQVETYRGSSPLGN